MDRENADTGFDPVLTPRKGMPSPRLGEMEFRARYLEQFVDPAFELLQSQLTAITDAAWDSYKNSRRSPYSRMTEASLDGFEMPKNPIRGETGLQQYVSALVNRA